MIKKVNQNVKNVQLVGKDSKEEEFQFITDVLNVQKENKVKMKDLQVVVNVDMENFRIQQDLLLVINA